MLKLESGLFLNNTTSTFDSQICSGSVPSITVQLVLFSLILLSSLVGNVLVVAVVYRDKTLRTSVNYFIVNMSLSDLLVPTISMPLWMTVTTNINFWFTGKGLEKILCKIAWATWKISNQISFFSMTALAADRFRAIIFPTKPALFSKKRRFVAIAAMWIFSVPFYGFHSIDITPGHASNITCMETNWSKEKFNFLLIYFAHVCVSIIVVTVLYLKITIFLYRQKNSLHFAEEIVKKRAKRNRKIITMLIVIVILFYIVWIPFYVLQFVSYINPNVSIPCIFLWIGCYIFPTLYPVINPVVYYVFNEKYRQGFKEIFHIIWVLHKEKNENQQTNLSQELKNRIENVGYVN